MRDSVTRRVCSLTGLKIESFPRRQVWRIAKISYGPMNPRERPEIADRGDWGRYDVPKHRTIYGATPRECAYAESLAAQRLKFAPGTHHDLRIRDLFDDDEDISFHDEIEREWLERNHMPPGKVAAGWRHERKLYSLRLPAEGYFVDVEAAESISAISRALCIEWLTVGALRGEDRALTTRVAEWLWHIKLDDGSSPHGIRYASKHGSDWFCWAVWLRLMDDGGSASDEPTLADSGTAIESSDRNSPLRKVALMNSLTVF